MKQQEVMVRAAAALLRRDGVPLRSRDVSHVVRLARSFQREGMGRFEALSAAGTLAARRQKK